MSDAHTSALVIAATHAIAATSDDATKERLASLQDEEAKLTEIQSAIVAAQDANQKILSQIQSDRRELDEGRAALAEGQRTLSESVDKFTAMAKTQAEERGRWETMRPQVEREHNARAAELDARQAQIEKASADDAARDKALAERETLVVAREALLARQVAAMRDALDLT